MPQILLPLLVLARIDSSNLPVLFLAESDGTKKEPVVSDKKKARRDIKMGNSSCHTGIVVQKRLT